MPQTPFTHLIVSIAAEQSPILSIGALVDATVGKLLLVLERHEPLL